ncbi:hypothetical protein D3C71_2118150 [compost metagenome]
MRPVRTDSFAGASPRWLRPNRIREDTYNPEFSADNTATSTTASTNIAAPGMRMTSSAATNGE